MSDILMAKIAEHDRHKMSPDYDPNDPYPKGLVVTPHPVSSARLVDRLLELHTQGSLHAMDQGNVCIGCGGQWPCSTIRVISTYAIEQLT